MITQYSTIMTEYFAQIWRVFSVQIPWLGLSFGQLLLGQLVVFLSIKVLKTLFASFEAEPSNVNKRYSRKEDPDAKNSDN